MSRSDSLSVLRIDTVRRYAIARVIAVGASEMQATAIGWQLYERTRSAYALGLIGLIQVIPVVLLALPAGHLVDRLHRRDVAIVSQLGLALATLGLALVSARAGPTAAIYGLVLAIGIATAFSSPSNASFVTQLVPTEHFANANAWLSSGFELAAMGGPALAGALIALTKSATLVYILGAASGLAFAATLATIRRPPKPVISDGDERGALAAGWRFVWNTELFLAAITLDLFAVLLGGATALLPVYAKDILHVGPTGLGWMRAAPSIGAFMMALLTTRLPPWKRPGRVLLLAVTGFGLATIGFGASRSFPLSLACLVLAGFVDNISVVIRKTLEQVITPDALRGRVSAVAYVFIGCSNELGAFESGLTAGLFGATASVVGGGIGTLLVVAFVAWKWRSLAQLGPLHRVGVQAAELAEIEQGL